VAGERKRLHNKQLYVLYSSKKSYSEDQIKKNDMGGTFGIYGEEERCIQGWRDLRKRITWRTWAFMGG
jgi:hypothetical protein